MEERRGEYPSMIERMTELEGKIDRILIAIDGNGEPGLLARVRVLETYLWRAIGFSGAVGLALAILQIILYRLVAKA